LAPNRFVIELVSGSPRAGAERIAALDDEVRDDAMELQAIVVLVAGQEDEVIDRDRRQAGVEAKGDRALVRLHRYQEVVGGVDRHRWRGAIAVFTGVAGGGRHRRAEVQRAAGRAGSAHAWSRRWCGTRAAAGVTSHIEIEGN